MSHALTILNYIGFSQAIFASFLMYTKRQKQIYDRIMIIWLLIIAIRFLLIAEGDFFIQYFDADFPIIIIPLLFGPNLYLYTSYIIKENNKFNVYHIFHFVPFLIFCSIYFLVSREIVYTEWMPFRISFTTIFFLSSITYTVSVFIMLRIYRNKIKSEQFSYDTAENRLFWLNFIPLLYVVTFGVYFCIKFYAIKANHASSSIEIISSIGLIIFSYVISFFGIRQQNLYKSIEVAEENSLRDNLSSILNNISELVHFEDHAQKELQVPLNDVVENNKKEKTSIIEEKTTSNELTSEKIHQIEKLKNCMLVEKPYLQADLTLTDLANKIDIPKHHLTQLLNTHLKKNFFEFVNEYRIEEIKNRINHPKYDHFTLVAIAYGCGFNSKSTFNTFFKQYTGCTPTEYKNKIKEEEAKKLNLDL